MVSAGPPDRYSDARGYGQDIRTQILLAGAGPSQSQTPSLRLLVSPQSSRPAILHRRTLLSLVLSPPLHLPCPDSHRASGGVPQSGWAGRGSREGVVVVLLSPPGPTALERRRTGCSARRTSVHGVANGMILNSMASELAPGVFS